MGRILHHMGDKLEKAVALQVREQCGTIERIANVIELQVGGEASPLGADAKVDQRRQRGACCRENVTQALTPRRFRPGTHRVASCIPKARRWRSDGIISCQYIRSEASVAGRELYRSQEEYQSQERCP